MSDVVLAGALSLRFQDPAGGVGSLLVSHQSKSVKLCSSTCCLLSLTFKDFHLNSENFWGFLSLYHRINLQQNQCMTFLRWYHVTRRSLI